MKQWFVDRSRYGLGLGHCLTHRYYRYHLDGVGIEQKKRSLPLVTGEMVHKAIEALLTWKDHSPVAIRATIANIQGQYRAQLEGVGFTQDSVAPDLAFTISEQCALIEALVWGWVKVCLPVVQAEYEIVAVEREFPVKLGEHRGHEIILQVRPDFVARAKTGEFKGQLGTVDLKTAKKIDQRYVDSWAMSPQMMIQTVGPEAHLGEPLTHYSIHGFVKGGRGEFKSRDRSVGERQYSSLIYAQLEPPNPPLVKQTQWRTDGYWINKKPLWQERFSQNADSQVSSIEWWVNNGLPQQDLAETFAIIGPYPRQGFMIESMLAEMLEHEKWWIDTTLDYPNPHLTGRLPRSWACDYGPGGEPCAMKRLCRRELGWEEPLSTGAYTARTPHHEQERLAIEQAQAKPPLTEAEVFRGL